MSQIQIQQQILLSRLTEEELHERIYRLASRGPVCAEREAILAELRRRLDGGAR